MHHGVRDFDAGREAVEDETADFAFENRDQIRKLMHILFCTVDRCGQVALERTGNLQNLIPA
jgi:hypothetical protein